MGVTEIIFFGDLDVDREHRLCRRWNGGHLVALPDRRAEQIGCVCLCVQACPLSNRLAEACGEPHHCVNSSTVSVQQGDGK